jgi:hypothetical protein
MSSIGGQSITKKLKQQLLPIGRRMRSAITTYNNLAAICISNLSFRITTAFKDVVSDQWNVWQLLYAGDSSTGSSEISPGIKRMAVD